MTWPAISSTPATNSPASRRCRVPSRATPDRRRIRTDAGPAATVELMRPTSHRDLARGRGPAGRSWGRERAPRGVRFLSGPTVHTDPGPPQNVRTGPTALVPVLRPRLAAHH